MIEQMRVSGEPCSRLTFAIPSSREPASVDSAGRAVSPTLESGSSGAVSPGRIVSASPVHAFVPPCVVAKRLLNLNDILAENADALRVLLVNLMSGRAQDVLRFNIQVKVTLVCFIWIDI